jgi:hypothetical protein
MTNFARLGDNFCHLPHKRRRFLPFRYPRNNEIGYFRAGTAIADRKAWHETFVTIQPTWRDSNEIDENR